MTANKCHLCGTPLGRVEPTPSARVCSDSDTCTRAQGARKEDRLEKIDRSVVVKEIRAFTRREGYAPTIRELAGALDCGHSTIQAALLALANEGKIKRTPGVARGIALVGGER